MGVLSQILKIHTDAGGDLRSIPTRLLNDALYSDLRFTNHELELMCMLVCQKQDHNKIRDSERVTTLQQWIATLERRTSSRSDGEETATDTESELSIHAEIRAEERKLLRRIAGPAPAKVTSEQEKERWRRIDEPSPSPEVNVRKRKR